MGDDCLGPERKGEKVIEKGNYRLNVEKGGKSQWSADDLHTLSIHFPSSGTNCKKK